MSFSVHIQLLTSDDHATFARSIVDDAFAGFVTRRSDTAWLVEFGDGGGAEIELGRERVPEEDIDGFWVNRPPSSKAFWGGLFSVMQWTGALCYWPGGAAVASEVALHQLPDDVAESLAVRVVGSGDELVAYLETT